MIAFSFFWSRISWLNNETVVLLGTYEKGWIQTVDPFFFFLGGLHVSYNLKPQADLT